MKTREEYLSTLSVGNIVAFKSNEDMYSGKVEEINEDTITIKTKNYLRIYLRYYTFIYTVMLQLQLFLFLQQIYN